MRPLVVGQAPSASVSGAARALTGRSGRRLASLMGMEFDEYLVRVDRINLLDDFPGGSGEKGDRFPIGAVRKAAARIKLGGRPFALLLGRGVADAFGIADAAFLTRLVLGSTVVGVVPHPSGVNLWWNDRDNEKAARDFLGEMLERYS